MVSKKFLTSGLAIVGIAAATGSTAAAASAKSLYVAAKGGNNANPCTQKAPCATILFAVGKAKNGDTIFVEKGSYRQDVIIQKRVRIAGVGGPVLDLKGKNNNGFSFLGPKSAWSTVTGFTVQGAAFEGIVAQQTSHITISNNVVKNNDQGIKAKSPQGECLPNGGGPGDCGEGIHLLGGVTGSTITGNTVTGNLGGILLSDEMGPTAHNTISKNKVHGNVVDCGITIVGHNPKATSGGKPQPKAAGVYGNLITGNTVNGNGTKGEGGGILMAVGAPGGAVYDNVIKGNSATGNGLAGITLHNHFFGPNAPAADTNGNKIIGNTLTNNGVADKSEAEFGGADFAKGNTVGILIGSGALKLTGIVITGNKINNSHFGIYTKNAPKVSAKANKFNKVAVQLKQS
jgi:parallel beta-helix repeat protein